MRLDIYLTEKNLINSRERGKRLIKDGKVSVNGTVCTKPSFEVNDEDDISIENVPDYVGRGLIKLETAFKAFRLDINNKVCADIGASTGGFTQCMLRYGAKKVYAIDVGHNQLDSTLVSNPMVVNCEGVNARYLTVDFFDESPEFMGIDLSFISLTLVMPAITACLHKDGDIVVLIKPQFEAGKQALNKKGIVKNPKDHIRVLETLFAFFEKLGLTVNDAVTSAIKGGDGNIEYLAHLKKSTEITHENIDIKALVKSAFDGFSEEK